MNEKMINELLEQLKKNLETVESAQKQVENTVNAYSALQGDVKEYVKELEQIKEHTKELVELLEEVKKHFLKNVSSEIIKAIEDAAKNISLLVTASSTELKELLNHIGIDINDVAFKLDNGISKVCSEITNAQAELKECLKSCETELLESIASAELILKALASDEQKRFEDLETRLSEMENRTRTNFNIVVASIVISMIIICAMIYFTK